MRGAIPSLDDDDDDDDVYSADCCLHWSASDDVEVDHMCLFADQSLSCTVCIDCVCDRCAAVACGRSGDCRRKRKCENVDRWKCVGAREHRRQLDV